MSGIIGMNDWELSLAAGRRHIDEISNGESKLNRLLNTEMEATGDLERRCQICRDEEQGVCTMEANCLNIPIPKNNQRNPRNQ